MRKLRLIAISLAMGGMLVLAQEKVAAPPVPVEMTVTVEARHDKEVPALNREDVMVLQGKQRLRVSDLVSSRDEHSALELYILIDDGSGASLGPQLGDLRQFIETQPASTSIGIGYMRNGTVQVVQSLTADHPTAAQNLRLPLGSVGIVASPFLALSDLIKPWPASPARHEVVLVTSGVDPLGGTWLILTWMPPSNMRSAPASSCTPSTLQALVTPVTAFGR